MRSAQIIGRVDPRGIEARLPSGWVDAVASNEAIEPGFIEGLMSVDWDVAPWSPRPAHWGLYVTRALGPHTDDVVVDYTLGVVLRGDHVLFTGNGRRVDRLERGSVYLLENKRLHGARGESLLVFAACDFAAWSFMDALDKARAWLDAISRNRS